MTTQNSDVLIIIPTLGQRLSYMRETLQSLVDQTLPVDVVVLAPSFDSDLNQLLDDFPTIQREVCNGNIATVVNSRLMNCDSYLFANWIGDDDRLPPRSVELAYDTISRDPECVLAFGRCTYIDEHGNTLMTSNIDRVARFLNPFLPAAIKLEGGLFSIAAFREVGGLDPTLRFTPDVDLVLKLAKFGRIRSIGKIVSEFRLHVGSDTTSRRAEQLMEAQTVQRRYLRPPAKGLHLLISPIIRLILRYFFGRVSN